MKITDPGVIRGGESELIDAITADMDWGAIGNVFLEKHKLGIDDDVEYKKGDIVIHENQIAYKLDFDVKVNLSILLDREGNYLSLSSDHDPDTDGESGEEDTGEEVFEAETETSDDRKSKEKDPEAAPAADDAVEQAEDEG